MYNTYIECEGVRVPASWTVEQLRLALAARYIRFENEEEIIWSFQAALRSINRRAQRLLQALPVKADTTTSSPKRKYKRRKKAKVEGNDA